MKGFLLAGYVLLFVAVASAKHSRPEAGPFSYLNNWPKNLERVVSLDKEQVKIEFESCKIVFHNNFADNVTLNNRGSHEELCPRIERVGFKTSGCYEYNTPMDFSDIGLNVSFEVIGKFCYVWLIEGRIASGGPVGQIHEFSHGVWTANDLIASGFTSTVSTIKVFSEVRSPIVTPLCNSIWQVAGVNGGWFQIARNPGFFPPSDLGSFPEDPPAGFASQNRWKRLHFHRNIVCTPEGTGSALASAIGQHVCSNTESPMTVFGDLSWRRGKVMLLDEALKALFPMQTGVSPKCSRTAAICRGNYWIENTSPVTLNYHVRVYRREITKYGDYEINDITLAPGETVLIQTGLQYEHNRWMGNISQTEILKVYVSSLSAPLSGAFNHVLFDNTVQNNVFTCGTPSAPGLLLSDDNYNQIRRLSDMSLCNGVCDELHCSYPGGAIPPTPVCNKHFEYLNVQMSSNQIAPVPVNYMTFDLHAISALNISRFFINVAKNCPSAYVLEYKNCSADCEIDGIHANQWTEFATTEALEITNDTTGVVELDIIRGPFWGFQVQRGQRLSFRITALAGSCLRDYPTQNSSCCEAVTGNRDFKLYANSWRFNPIGLGYCSEGELSTVAPPLPYSPPPKKIAFYLPDNTYLVPAYFKPKPDVKDPRTPVNLNEYRLYRILTTYAGGNFQDVSEPNRDDVFGKCCGCTVEVISNITHLRDDHAVLVLDNFVPELSEFGFVDDWLTRPGHSIWAFNAAVQYLLKTGYLYPIGASMTSNVAGVGEDIFWEYNDLGSPTAELVNGIGSNYISVNVPYYNLLPPYFGQTFASINNGASLLQYRSVPGKGPIFWANDDVTYPSAYWSPYFEATLKGTALDQAVGYDPWLFTSYTIDAN